MLFPCVVQGSQGVPHAVVHVSYRGIFVIRDQIISFTKKRDFEKYSS